MIIERIRTAVPTSYRRSKLFETAVIETDQSLTVLPDGKRKRDPTQEDDSGPHDHDNDNEPGEHPKAPAATSAAPNTELPAAHAPALDIPHIDVIA